MSKSKLHFALKWTADDPSNAIILTFGGDWHQPLVSGDIDVVFRKMGPRHFEPDLLFAYVAAPISAIVARVAITRYERLSLRDAERLANRANLTPKELRSYAIGYDDVIVMELAPVVTTRHPITLDYLSKHYEFWPSSTYTPLSKAGVATLNKLGFSRRKGSSK